MNLPKRLLEEGFKSHEEEVFKSVKPWPYQYRPGDGWMGCTVYHPDNSLIKGDKRVDFSLQGLLTTLYDEFNPFKDPQLVALFKAKGIKLIGLRKAGEVIYHSFTGVMPDDGLIEEFLRE